MPRTLFCADTHFGHRGMLSPRMPQPRPFKTIEAHDEALVAAWNKSVRPDDIVWHLGDFAYKCSVEYAASVGRGCTVASISYEATTTTVWAIASNGQDPSSTSNGSLSKIRA